MVFETDVYFKQLLAWAAVLVLPSIAAQPRIDSIGSIHGDGTDQVTAMVADAQGNIYLAGATTSFDLGTPGAFQPRRASSNLYAYDRATWKLRPVFPPSPAEIFNLASDTQLPATLYAAASNGLMKTSDDGATWTVLPGPFPASQDGWHVSVAPSHPNLLYATSGNSVFKSVNAGATWSPTVPLPIPEGDLYGAQITVDPGDPSHIFKGGLYVSHDGGNSWNMRASDLSKLTFDRVNPSTAYALVSGPGKLLLVKSTDHGETFTNLNGPDLNFIEAILADAKRPGVVYISGSGDAGEGIFRSTDGGTTWTLAERLELEPEWFVEDPAAGSIYAIGFDGRQLLRSDDGFATISTITQGSQFLASAVSTGSAVFFASQPTSEIFVSKLAPGGEVLFTTYLGGLFGSAVAAIALDAAGNIYVAGWSTSPDFPVNASLQAAAEYGYGIYLLKLAGDGSRLEYSTRIAGTGYVNSVAVDVSGNIYLAGTANYGYPTTPGALQAVCQCFGPPRLENGFATKLAPDGSTLIYSTYLGSGPWDRAWAIVPDGDGNAYVAGTMLWKLNSVGTSLLWSKNFSPGEFRAATLDSSGNLYTCGATGGPGLYTTANAFQSMSVGYFGHDPAGPPASDAFAAKFSPDGDVLYSTLLSGRAQQSALAIAVDQQGNATVAGWVFYPRDFPTRLPLQAAFSANSGFLAKFNGDGSDLLYSTYLGDASGFSGVALARQPSGELVSAESTYDAGIRVHYISETSPPSPLHIDSVLNDANLYAGPLAPGEWILLRGSRFGPDSRALLNDLPLRLQLVSASEILARVPDDFQPIDATPLRIESGGQSSPSLRVRVELTSPAIFTQDGSGDGPALAFNEDGTPNTAAHPTQKGSQIAIVINGIPTGLPVMVSFNFAPGIPATLQTAPVPGLPGDTYSIVVVTIPQDTYIPRDGNVIFSMLSNGERAYSTVSIAP